MIELGKVKPTV